MLRYNQSPFGENKACKQCMHKPCRRLLSGPVYPGKLIFVHRREFQSWPCNVSFREQQAEEQECLTDDMEVVEGTITVTNPRWEHIDQQKLTDSPEIAHVGDKVKLMADIQNYGEGGRVTFDIYDVSTPPLCIATAVGSHSQGIGSAEWVIKDVNESGDDLALEFEGIARSVASPRAELSLGVMYDYCISA